MEKKNNDGKLTAYLKRNNLSLTKPKDIAILAKKAFRVVKLNGGSSFKAINEVLHNEAVNKTEANDSLSEYEYILNQIKITNAQENKMFIASELLKYKPSFSVIVVINNIESLFQTIRLINKQAYSCNEIFIVCNSETKKKIKEDKYYNDCIIVEKVSVAIEKCNSEYIMFLNEGDYLQKNCLFEFAVKLNQCNAVDLLFSDNDFYDENEKRLEPYFKIGWSEDLLLIDNYINRAAVFSKKLIDANKKSFENNNIDEACYLTLLLNSEKLKVERIEGVLFSFPLLNKNKDYLAIRNSILETKKIEGSFKLENGITAFLPKAKDKNKISLVIPSLDDTDFDNIINDIKNSTAYPNYEIIFVGKTNDRANVENVKYINVNEFSCKAELINLAVEQLDCYAMVFLDRNCRFNTKNWLEIIAADLENEKNGIVAPMIVNSNNVIRESAVFLTRYYDCYIPYFVDMNKAEKHYQNFVYKRRNIISATGACYAIKRSIFNEIGGLDEKLSLKTGLVALGIEVYNKNYKNVYEPTVNMLFNFGFDDLKADDYKLKDKFDKIYDFSDPLFNAYLSEEYSNIMLNTQPIVVSLCGTPSLAKRNIDKILLIKPDHIGDATLSIPAVRMIREKFPNAKITMLCGPWTKSLFEMQPEIDEIKTFAFFQAQSQFGSNDLTKSDLDILIEELKKERYDLTINLRRHEEAKYVAANSADYCLTYSATAEEDNISHPVPAFKDYHHVEVKWSMADELKLLVNAIEPETKYDKPLTVDPIAVESAKEKMKKIAFFNSDKKLVGIHLGAGHETRQWGYEYFAKLADLIVKYTDSNVIFLGGKDDEQYNDKVMGLMKNTENVISIAGVFSLKEFIYIQGQLDYFIGNNSGPMHIAGIQGTPTLGIFGNTFSDQGWGPIGEKTITVKKSTQCAICDMGRRNMCDFDMACLTKLYPNDVFKAFQKLITVYPTKK